MGDHGGQALQRLLLEDGEVPVLPGESPRSQHRGGYGSCPAGTSSFLVSPSATAGVAVEGGTVSRAVFLSSYSTCLVWFSSGTVDLPEPSSHWPLALHD